MSKIMNCLFIPAVSLMAAGCCSKSGAPAIAQDPEIEKQEVGQMTELAIDVLGEFKDGEFILDEDKLHEVIAGYKVGSILNAPGPVAQSLEKWQEIIGRIQEVSMKEIGIPCIYGLDQVHGTTYILGGTMFPQNINMGASLNPDLALRPYHRPVPRPSLVQGLGKLR